MSRAKSLAVLFIVLAAIAGLFLWRSLGSSTPVEYDADARAALERVATKTPTDPEMAAYFEAHGADSMTPEELVALYEQYELEHGAEPDQGEAGGALRGIED